MTDRRVGRHGSRLQSLLGATLEPSCCNTGCDRLGEPVPVSELCTLLDVLRERAVSDGAREGFRFLTYAAGGTLTESVLSFAALEHRARAVAAALQRRCCKGERALILCPPGLDYIAAFYGCVMAGVVAVPTYPPRNGQHWVRLATIIADAEATAILTNSDLSERLATWAGADAALPWRLSVDKIEPDAANDWRDPGVGPDDLVFLQYTSGTTGTPKGVMVGHSQLLDNAGRICAVTDLDRFSIMTLWLPPYHDMGLVGGIVLPVFVGSLCVLMSPDSFLQMPARWPQSMSAYRATHTAAPNFAYRLCVDQVSTEEAASLDLATLRVAACGAEVVRAETLRAFAEKFRPTGFAPRSFVPAYGLAETVLMATAAGAFDETKAVAVSSADLSAGRLVLREQLDGLGAATESDGVTTAVSCGRVIAGHDLRIVDPETRQERAAGEVGEIWLSGPSVAAGFWRKPEATEETFKARLADPAGAELERDPGPDYLRTGDLGALLDGELYVLGRIKEMVIVNGRNHYATDLETTASARTGRSPFR